MFYNYDFMPKYSRFYSNEQILTAAKAVVEYLKTHGETDRRTLVTELLDVEIEGVRLFPALVNEAVNEYLIQLEVVTATYGRGNNRVRFTGK